MNKEEIKKLEEGTELNIQFIKRGGLVPTVVQDFTTNEVLMVGYANQKALEETLNSGYATLWSTTRNELWTKGLTSGDMLKMKEIRIDCDQDALLYIVERVGKGVCHTKNSSQESRTSCFYRKIGSNSGLEFI